MGSMFYQIEQLRLSVAKKDTVILTYEKLISSQQDRLDRQQRQLKAQRIELWIWRSKGVWMVFKMMMNK
ncbi:hypothetical protein [Spirosoma rigui]|uniref:hypothetical protein n=1 Tax=Spirosoma rigui TaxID=564064 RepID=UPI0009B0DD25|nr:hypothetical protein [Spirosoma rigui]